MEFHSQQRIGTSVVLLCSDWVIAFPSAKAIFSLILLRRPSHCGQGMVFAVNPTAAKSFDAFQAAANATVSNSTTSSNGTSSSAPSPSASASGTPSGAMARFSLSSASAVTLMGLAVGLLL